MRHIAALIILLLLAANLAHAYPASTAFRYVNNCPGEASAYSYATGLAACQGQNTNLLGDAGMGQCQVNGTSFYVQNIRLVGSACIADVYHNTAGLQSTDAAVGGVESAPACLNGGTLSGSTCVCGSGQTDTGTACETPACPAVGSDMGKANLTVGWALSPTPDANDITVQPNFASLYSSEHCTPSSSGMCPTAVDTAAPGFVDNCWRSQAPNANGLYRLSCDFKLKSAGTSACTPSAGAPSDATNTGPACPTGNVGTVNGVAVCLGTMPASGVDLGPSQAAGNPRAGTSPVADSNVAREPSAASGGGPDARGGPGVTVGAGGSIGTGNNRAAGAGTGTGGNAPLEVEVVTCGLPDTPPCKIDETGTPTGSGAFSNAQTSLQGVADGIGGLGVEVTKGDGKDTGWKIGFNPPSGCTNPSVTLPAIGTWEADLCQHASSIGAVMSFLWYLLTLGSCLAMIRGTMTGGTA